MKNINYSNSGVYAVWVHKKPQYKYYGSSLNVKQRIMQHKQLLLTGNHHNKYLQKIFDNSNIKNIEYYYAKVNIQMARIFEAVLIGKNPEHLNINNAPETIKTNKNNKYFFVDRVKNCLKKHRNKEIIEFYLY